AVVSGSMPPGASPTFVAAFANALRHRNSCSHRQAPGPLVVDASGATLHQLLAGMPDIVKPNEDEIMHLMGESAGLAEQVRFLQEDLIPSRLAPGAGVILSRGREGAVLVREDSVLQARPPEIQAVNAVGCGDALLAGFVNAWLAGAADDEAIRDGVATGTAAALEEVAGVVNPHDVARIRKQVEVTHGVHIA
ncbi:MAG TPA: PfkB family carbohydrate kinase, partial [Thermomicrobiales bacterium]|nr:PfkB family carbohydrate kinase [Thermomicrobiales bacterium]